MWNCVCPAANLNCIDGFGQKRAVRKFGRLDFPGVDDVRQQDRVYLVDVSVGSLQAALVVVVGEVGRIDEFQVHS